MAKALGRRSTGLRKVAHKWNRSCPLSLANALASQELDPFTLHPSPLLLVQPPAAAMTALLSWLGTRTQTSLSSNLMTSTEIAFGFRAWRREVLLAQDPVFGRALALLLVRRRGSLDQKAPISERWAPKTGFAVVWSKTTLLWTIWAGVLVKFQSNLALPRFMLPRSLMFLAIAYIE
ncbi:hypothetical protein KC356_g330 [Hortaea werneckii]|nr:hypothetical protein KC356_g330 [Hortaea werneckii]